MAEVILPGEAEHLCVRVYHAGNAQQIVVERDDALLTPDEVNKHWVLVMAAIKVELETWMKYRCSIRKKRRDARNIIDVKWVLKWKHETEARSAEESQKSGPVQTVRAIRARLTVRGFKDMDAQGVDNYSGTSQRYSQRLIGSLAARNGWDLCTTDISKAFLQGSHTKNWLKPPENRCGK